MHVNGLGKLFGLTLAAWGAAKVYETVKAEHTEEVDDRQSQAHQLVEMQRKMIVPRDITDTVRSYLKIQVKAGDIVAFNRGINDYVDPTMSLEERAVLWAIIKS